MKKYITCLLIILLSASINIAQTSPSSPGDIVTILGNQAQLFSMSDTINFTPYPGSTTINNQYLYDGALFSGYNGSSDPIIEDYINFYGRVLRSDTWFNPLRLNFVDSANSSLYKLMQNIEFDNPISSEVDYISVNVYDSMNNVIYHYLSASPEHVVINLASPNAAYVTFDDSAGTAYVLDNFYFNDGTIAVEHHLFTDDQLQVFPNPFQNEISVAIQKQNIQQIELSIKNILGQTMFYQQENPLGNSFIKTFDMSFLSNGIYLFEVIIDGERTVRKIVKE